MKAFYVIAASVLVIIGLIYGAMKLSKMDKQARRQRAYETYQKHLEEQQEDTIKAQEILKEAFAERHKIIKDDYANLMIDLTNLRNNNSLDDRLFKEYHKLLVKFKNESTDKITYLNFVFCEGMIKYFITEITDVNSLKRLKNIHKKLVSIQKNMQYNLNKVNYVLDVAGELRYINNKSKPRL